MDEISEDGGKTWGPQFSPKQRQLSGGDEDGGSGGGTAFQKDIKFLMAEFGYTKEQALKVKKTLSGQSKEQFILNTYNNTLKEGGDAAAAEKAMEQAGAVYDKVMGAEPAKPGGASTAPGGEAAPAGYPRDAKQGADGNWYVPLPGGKWGMVKPKKKMTRGMSGSF